MKIARGAKQLAMLITVVALAVVTMACQGAVGPTGDDGAQGPQGPKGDTGDTGSQGSPGDTPFPNLPATGVITAMTAISTNPTKDDGFAVAPSNVDVSQYFHGGIGGLTYRVVGQRIWGAAEDHTITYANYNMAASYTANAAKWFTAKLDEDGKTLVFSVPAAVQETAVGETAAEYDDNRSVIVVEAKDSQDKLAVHLLVVGNNRAPRDQETLPNNFRIGVQPDTVRGDDGELIMALAALDDSGGVWEDFRCTHYNTCEFKLAGFFMDDEGDSNLTFSAKAKKPSEAKHLSFTSIDGGIMIVGMEATIDDPLTTAQGEDESSIVISVIATDPGGLKLESDLTVAVEARPTVKVALPDFTIKKADIDANNMVDDYVVRGDLRLTDEDDAFSDLTISSKSTDPTVIADDGVVKATNALTLALIGDAGTATVTVRATVPIGTGTEGIGQWVEDTIVVTVTN